MNKIITAISLLLMLGQAGIANAETINLVCVSPRTAYNVNVDIDTSRNTVTATGVSANGVYIDKGVITFTLNYPDGGIWFHNINRNTGTMIVKDVTTNTVNSKYNCEKAKPKF